MKLSRIAGLTSTLLLAACATQPARAPAPIVEKTKPSGVPATPKAAPVQNGPSSGVRPAAAPATPSSAEARGGKVYTVKPGDTLYSIALENGLDYKEVAAWNQLADVNLIKVDQLLRLSDPADDATAGDGAAVVVRPLKPVGEVVASAKAATLAYPKAIKASPGTDAETVARQADGPAANAPVAAKPVEVKPIEVKPAESKPITDNKPVTAGGDDEIAWAWPSVGKVITPFSDAAKGIDIGGKLGQPVQAAAPGKIVYAGAGLRGYGKLVIIKHNKMYLSAYAHNSQLLVKEGDSVKKGDKIAEMGNSDAEQVKLHFEIRRFGKPVDPTKFLTAG
ncbi:peptidoglycan DD-metalloendopeptidase family protein [Chitinimonas sp.]|uniref:peptidoglycan DD-metalloendopeptidase family protein n=1 Tax=Chitinimonas sp. TaxID=1934313 RepID=UPI0035B233A3